MGGGSSFGTSLAYSGGCMGPQYPGSAPLAAGKPNVYMYTKEKTKVKFNLNSNNNSNLLASTPIIPSSGMEILVNEEGTLQIDKAEYQYLFYDMRTDLVSPQEKFGECVAGGDLLKTMNEMLQLSGFNKREQNDFTNYWSAKLPKFEQVCIYPQTNEHLSSMSTFDISPKPDHINRILFVVIPVVNGKRPKQRFSKAPEKLWNPSVVKRAPSSAQFVLREWGVAFLTIPEIIEPPKNELSVLTGN